MNFIKYIDELKDQYIKSNPVINSNTFHFYTQIDVNESITTNKIICLKNQFSYILINVSGIKIYLDDFDIVCILIYLVSEQNEIGQKVISYMYELLEGKQNQFSFKIEGQEFIANGLPLIESDLTISTKADINISINEFITILNLILEKERISRKEKVLENIICKYICLAEYYGLNDKVSQAILNDLEFPIDRTIRKNKNIVSRAGDKKFVVDFNTFIKHKEM